MNSQSLTLPQTRDVRPPKRDAIMISHANPEDNEFTLWLALQLAREGYKVWSDITKLLGGDQFWTDIEEVIREKAVKVIYVLSKTSNESNRGFRKELHLADSVGRQLRARNFVVPVAIDDLLPRDYNVYVQQLNSISFQNWALGLKDLLKVLRRDRVPKLGCRNNAATVSLWWRNFRSAKAGISRQPDQYYSNWFQIKNIPSGLFWHSLENESGRKINLDFDLPFQFVQSNNAILTFADEEEVKKAIGPDLQIVASDWVEVEELSKGKAAVGEMESRPLKNLFTQLLREAWQSWIEKLPVGIYQLSGGATCAYFRGIAENASLKVTFTGVDGKQGWRSLVGTWTRAAKYQDLPTKGYWHFAVQARPRLWPCLLYHVSSHVIFSDDGRTPWDSHRRMHKARRSRCKNWYNDEWRDRLLAAMSYLAQPDGEIRIPLCGAEMMSVSLQPLIFKSKISCKPLPSVFLKKEEESPDVEDDEFDEDEETFE